MEANSAAAKKIDNVNDVWPLKELIKFSAFLQPSHADQIEVSVKVYENKIIKSIKRLRYDVSNEL